MWAFAIIAYPISRVLDYLLGQGHTVQPFLLHNLCAFDLCLLRLAALACHDSGRADMACSTVPLCYYVVTIFLVQVDRKALKEKYHQPTQDSMQGTSLLHGDGDSILTRSCDCNECIACQIAA